ncbi:hypothetical protein HNO88_002575 [Novosphingobium chloroacetimidivorans]|uniref:Uncharacterized protein n=1 Tax=Novosphingobium chloroacetimidivorans TaxID=1428314 RepID=A0A7W7KB54_9SPHN|nr:hypothetical protein [Novosphingobium chloroacetimidivorans]MBB4859246.1 hypothetical protein [Novosphingobium chloroacetimidivorans]
MTSTGRLRIFEPLIFALVLFAAAASAEQNQPYPSSGTKQEQWTYVTGLASEGFAMKATEANISGRARDTAFRRRGVRFFRAAKFLRAYIDQHFVTQAAKRSPAYVYASFTLALYLENAGDVWRARSWYEEARRYDAFALSAGQAGPTYNGAAIRSLIPVRLERVTRLANLNGGTHPQAEISISFSAPSDYQAGVAFLLHRQDRIPDLFGGGETVTDQPTRGDAP